MPRGGAAPAALQAEPSAILSSPERYDGQLVQVEGRVAETRHKVSRRGNPYTTFELVGEGGAALKVSSFSHLPRERRGAGGGTATTRRVGRYTFHNEIDASKGSVERLG